MDCSQARLDLRGVAYSIAAFIQPISLLMVRGCGVVRGRRKVVLSTPTRGKVLNHRQFTLCVEIEIQTQTDNLSDTEYVS